AQAPRGTEPPRKVVQARRPLDPDDFAARSGTEPGSLEVHTALELFAGHRDEALADARRLRQLASLWDETEDEGDVYASLGADARRVARAQPCTPLPAAASAVPSPPRTLARLSAGHIPVVWFEQLLRRVRRLTADQCRLLDDRVADWDLANLRADRFSRELGRLIAWFGTAAAQPSPQEQRDVGLHVSPEHDGTASIIVTGPIHEIVDFSHRLDAS